MGTRATVKNDNSHGTAATIDVGDRLQEAAVGVRDTNTSVSSRAAFRPTDRKELQSLRLLEEVLAKHGNNLADPAKLDSMSVAQIRELARDLDRITPLLETGHQGVSQLHQLLRENLANSGSVPNKFTPIPRRMNEAAAQLTVGLSRLVSDPQSHDNATACGVALDDIRVAVHTLGNRLGLSTDLHDVHWRK